jgi:hypothetical protein
MIVGQRATGQPLSTLKNPKRSVRARPAHGTASWLWRFLTGLTPRRPRSLSPRSARSLAFRLLARIVLLAPAGFFTLIEWALILYLQSLRQW